MVNRISLRYALLLCLPLLCGMQTILGKDIPEPLPPELDGSMMPYNFEACSPAEWPDSLRPIYAAYVARHGARYLTSGKKIISLEKALKEASETGSITEEGRDFAEYIEKVSTVSDGKWGALSTVGVAEQQLLADEMAKLLPPLSGKASVHTLSSYVPRAVMTMYEFDHRLTELNRDVEIDADEGKRFSELVYCFGYDKAYADYRKHGDWQSVYADYLERHIPTTPALRLGIRAGGDENRLRQYTMDMYGILQGNRAAGLPAPTTQWMTEEEYRACFMAQNLRHYLCNNVTPLSDLCIKATAPLVRQLIADADTAISDTTGNQPVVNGYFGHAETLLPLLSALHIPGCFTLTSDYDSLYKDWKLYEIVPLGANFMTILLRAPSGEIYAAVRHNGRDVAPIPGEEKILPWSRLSSYWQSLIEPAN